MARINMKYKVKVRYESEETGVTIQDDLFFGNEREADDYIRDVILKCTQKVETEFYCRFENLNEWILDRKTTYYHPNHPLEFALVHCGNHEYRFPHTFMQEIVIHMPSRLCFYIDNRENALYSEDIENSPNSVFYKFSYNINGESYKFITYYPDKDPVNEEMRKKIKQTLLIPGAKWFCEHLRERWKHYFNVDFHSIYEKKIKEIGL